MSRQKLKIIKQIFYRYNCESKNIATHAFYGYTYLNLSSVPDGCFWDCKVLTSFTFGANLTSLGDSAFRVCSTLKGEVNLQYVTSIGGYAFQSCTKITGVTFSPNLNTIGSRCFQVCTNLTGDIEIPSNATSIGEGIFRYTSISSLTFLGDNTKITPGTWEESTSNGRRTLR